MIQAAITGRLGKDAQPVETKTGTSMTTANIAVDCSTRDQQATVWVRVVAFNRLADILARHEKGETIAASGRMELNRWTGSDGQERENWNLLADSLVSARTARGGVPRATPRTAPPPDRAGEVPFDDDVAF